MDIQEHLNKALEHDERGEILEAVACLDGISDDIPQEAGYLKFVGQLYQRLGEDQKGLKFISAALELAPDDADLHLALGYHNVDNALLQDALANFQEALRLDPRSQMAQLYLGRTQDFLGDLDAAEKSLIKAVALGAGELEPHVQLARVLLREGKFEQARRKFEQIEEMSPGHRMAELGSKRVDAFLNNRVPIATQQERDAATVVCVKQGTKYGPDYVNRLYSMVSRNSTLSPDVVVFTEDGRGLNDGITVQPLPDTGYEGWWNKVSLFRDDLTGVGDRMLYFDLDVVITGNIDRLLTYDSDFTIMDNDYVPGFNTSVFLLKTGSRPEIYADFTQAIADDYEGDQDWVATMAPDAELWPAMWCVPYRLRAAQQPPAETKVVVFSGRPNPEEYPSPWVRDYWK